MDACHSQGVLPAVLARRTPRGQQKPADCETHKWAGSWSFQSCSGQCAERPERGRERAPWTPDAPMGYFQRFWHGARLVVRRNLLLVGCTSGLEVDISELLWAVCRASRAPLPEHAMDIRHSQGVLPTVLARRTPRGPPSQPPEQPPEPGCAGGHFLEVQGYPRGAQQRPLLETTVPSTIGSGLGAPCGGRRRPGTGVPLRGGARGGLQKIRDGIDPQQSGDGAARGGLDTRSTHQGHRRWAWHT
jgi:hypothetical protein